MSYSCSEGEEEEYEYYSEEEVEESASHSSSEARQRKKKRDKKEKKKKKDKKREKKSKKKEKKQSVRKSHRKRDRREKRGRERRERRRARSASCDYSDYSYDDEPEPRRGGRDRRRSRSRRDRTPPRRDDYRRSPPPRRSRSRSPPRREAIPNVPRMELSNKANMTLREACDAAGRGETSGNTAVDDEITVHNADEELVRDPDRFETFDEIKDFPRDIRDALKEAGFPGPSQIQAYTWPLGLRGKDIIGIAATGSGKTLAFLLPAFTAMLDDGIRPERDGPGLLVLSPTRELAQQIENEAARFGKYCGMRSVAMYGGSPKGGQMAKYRGGVHCIVACPGRLNDFLEGGQVRLEGCRKLVLDEADRMLDMGFEPQIRKILAKVPRKRHTLFFTATWPREVRKLAEEILNRPYKVMIGNRDELKGNQDITQVVRVVDAYQKNDVILGILRDAGLADRDSYGKCLVFCNTKRMCEQLSQTLARYGMPCAAIHGDKDQMQRDDALNGLKRGRIKILCATDVAARGLDIKGVGLVLNYDPANNAEDYVHRIGRTGRAGAKGFAITILTSSDAGKARGIMEVMERTDQEIPDELEKLAGCAPQGRRRGKGKGEGKGGRGRSRSRSRSPR
eukprot:TRINITY_DN2077_c0_g6_i1.p1 TRINITY_DN2077_c0_g6~~TRINITY_DN2077_c0_g6_i1.p1  ORF type:complete len:623 (+),score=155.07 TRINITY_DN2077_c0_g6_i1:134-2002(+)